MDLYLDLYLQVYVSQCKTAKTYKYSTFIGLATNFQQTCVVRSNDKKSCVKFEFDASTCKLMAK